MSEDQIQIPIQLTQALVFEDAFSSMKERFMAEMKKIDDAMNTFSTKLLQNQSKVSSDTSTPDHHLDLLSNSPLVEGEGADRTLKLQFDVSHFHPNQVIVSILKNKLTVSATHEEKTDSSTTFRQYHREFFFPVGVDPKSVTSTLSKDGVLIVQAPVPTK